MKTILILLMSFTILTITNAQTSDCDYTGTAILVGTSCTTSTFNSTDNTDYWNSAAGCSGSDNDDAWWWFTATATSTIITYNSTDDAIMHLFTGACATNMTALVCANSTTTGNETITYATTIGTNYAIRVQRNSSDQNMNGTICVYSTGPGSECNTSLPITPGGACISSSVTDTDISFGSTSCSANTASREKWYTFTLASAQTIGVDCTIPTDLTGQDNLKLQVIRQVGACGGADDVEVGCSDAQQFDGAQSESIANLSLAAGTYHVRVINNAGIASGNMSFTNLCVCVQSAPACATLNSPANNANNITNCSSLTWTAPAVTSCTAVSSYDVYYGTTNPPPFYANTTSTSYQITGAPATTYYWQIRPKNATGSAAGCTIRSFSTSATGNPQYTMVDDATSPSPYDCVTLTTTTNDQRGCAWDLNSTLNFTSDFSYDFRVNLGSSDAGADGLSFVMQNDPLARCKCGTAGGSMGAGGITNSVIVEIDTYLNYEDRDDFNTSFVGCSGAEDPDHLDIWFNGNINPNLDFNCDATGAGERPATATAVRLRNAGSNYNIENGLDHILRISWSSATGTLTARVMNTALSTTYGTISSTFNPLTVFGTNTPYFGFTASTGGLNNNQSFCNPPILLPVELVTLHSYCYENERKVYWSTASENNNAYFTLEKSLDGIHFTTVKIEAGNSQKIDIVREYEFIDSDVENPEVYYRLSQTDMNGNTKTFDVISSNCKSTEKEMSIEKLYEKGNQLEIQINLADKTMHELTIVDLTGKIIEYKQIDANKGAQTVSIDNHHLSTGFYLIQLKNMQTSITDKFWID